MSTPVTNTAGFFPVCWTFTTSTGAMTDPRTVHPDAIRAAADVADNLNRLGLTVSMVEVQPDRTAPESHHVLFETERRLSPDAEVGPDDLAVESDHAAVTVYVDGPPDMSFFPADDPPTEYVEFHAEIVVDDA